MAQAWVGCLDRERRWFVLERPRRDTNGGSETEVTVTSKLQAKREREKVGFTKTTARRHRRVGGRAVTVTAMLHRQRYRVIQKEKKDRRETGERKKRERREKESWIR